MFGIFDEITDAAVGLASSTISAVTFGALERRQVAALIGTGLTIYEIADATGLAVEVVQAVLDE